MHEGPVICIVTDTKTRMESMGIDILASKGFLETHHSIVFLVVLNAYKILKPFVGVRNNNNTKICPCYENLSIWTTNMLYHIKSNDNIENTSPYIILILFIQEYITNKHLWEI